MRVVDVWNSLPSSVVEAKTLESFERKLDNVTNISFKTIVSAKVSIFKSP